MTAIVLDRVKKSFPSAAGLALDTLTAEIPEKKITGIIGPDGAGKTTLIRVMASLMKIDSGSCTVFGSDSEEEAGSIHEIIGYLPQKFGLYEELTVAKNLSLYADLQGVEKEDSHFEKLLAFSGLAPFLSRLVQDLSGGMKQKLGLMAALLRKPQLLLLDEPTFGIDPISQADLWEMFDDLNRDGMTLVTTTSYLHEAEKCHHILLLNEGKILYSGAPGDFIEKAAGKSYYFMGAGEEKRTILDRLIGKHGIIDAMVEGEKIRLCFAVDNPPTDPTAYGLHSSLNLRKRAPTFEDAFIYELGGIRKRPPLTFSKSHPIGSASTSVVEAVELSRYFGSFKAVDNVSFSLKRGEILGLLGPNGAGKSTTFKMLCGLLRPSQGEALVGGISMRRAPSKARSLIGYMAQKFSLYDNLTVLQNLRFFYGIYSTERGEEAIEKMVALFDLKLYLQCLTKELPLGYKQRLALACSVMHEPAVLFLDEPTSGVDLLTRREFWHEINLLASSGVAVMVSTHLLEEAEYCDKIVLIHRGALQAIGEPDELKRSVASEALPEPTLNDVFCHYCGEGGVSR